MVGLMPLVWPMVSVCLFFFSTLEKVWKKYPQHLLWHDLTVNIFSGSCFTQFHLIQYNIMNIITRFTVYHPSSSFLGTDYEIFVCRRQVFFQAPPWRVPSPLGRTKLWPGRPGTLGPWGLGTERRRSTNRIYHHRSPWCWGIDSTFFLGKTMVSQFGMAKMVKS